MNKSKFTTAAFMVGLFCSTIFPAALFAADVWPYIYGTGSYRAIVIEGNIQKGDYETFLNIVRENQGLVSTIYIFSPGGDFYEAMKIGRAMRSLELSSLVPSRDSSGSPSCSDEFKFKPEPKDPANCTCASAGFFIHIGGVHRGGTYLAVHRPYFTKGGFGKLSQVEAKKAFSDLQNNAREYMQEMGVSSHVQEDVLGTPSDKALILDEKTIKTYFWLNIPYRHEWLRNKCSKLSAAEAARLEDYSNRVLRAMREGKYGRSSRNISDTEYEDFNSLQAKKDQERDCEIEINELSRLEAYERFFNEKPNDYKYHDFSKWSEAAKYIGKKYYTLLGEESFQEEEICDLNRLARSATASTPYIGLWDSQSNRRTVTMVDLISTPNPSKKFTELLINSLEKAWGKPSSVNKNNEWKWLKEKFSAELSHGTDPKGSFLKLLIKGK